MVIVPNSQLSASIVTNYYQPKQQMSVLLTVGVSYASDLEHVEKATVEVATEVMGEIKGGIPESEPLIRYNDFGDFRIDFTVIMQTGEVASQYLIKHEFIKRLHKRYAEEGIEIPFPSRTITRLGPTVLHKSLQLLLYLKIHYPENGFSMVRPSILCPSCKSSV